MKNNKLFEVKIEIINMNNIDIIKTSDPTLEEVEINESSYTEGN